jgi:hypothetical protein
MMDFGTYNRATRAQEGEWMHVLHPETFQPLYLHMDGKKATASAEPNETPVRMLIQGVHSPDLRKMQKAYEDQAALLRAKMGRANGIGEIRAIQRQLEEAEQKHGFALLRAAVLSWENFPYLGEVLVYSEKAKDDILPKFGEFDCPTEWLAEQAAQYSRDKSNFFQKPATD